VKAKAVATLAVAAVCLSIAGGLAADHRVSGTLNDKPVPSQTDSAAAWQISGGGVAPGPGASHDLFDAPLASAS